MGFECDYFELATKSIHWLISYGEVNEDFLRYPQSRTWTTPGSDLKVEMSHLGSGSFAFVWKVGFLEIHPANRSSYA
jgi:hypothetical protein